MDGFAIFGGFIGFVFAIFILVLIIKLDVEMADIAEDKGYNGKTAFIYCFFLGILGFLYVIALPNRRISLKEKTNSVISEKSTDTELENRTEKKADKVVRETIQCPHCGHVQSKNISRCLSCSKMINE